MRPRTKIPVPEPTGTQFENFDRLARILVAKKPPKKQQQTADKAKPQAEAKP